MSEQKSNIDDKKFSLKKIPKKPLLVVIFVLINIIVIAITAFLSLVSQLGDMAFSAMKRYFGIKDFSNLIPGHGGVLDRMDSIIFVVLGFTFFISIL